MLTFSCSYSRFRLQYSGKNENFLRQYYFVKQSSRVICCSLRKSTKNDQNIFESYERKSRGRSPQWPGGRKDEQQDQEYESEQETKSKQTKKEQVLDDFDWDDLASELSNFKTEQQSKRDDDVPKGTRYKGQEVFIDFDGFDDDQEEEDEDDRGSFRSRGRGPKDSYENQRSSRSVPQRQEYRQRDFDEEDDEEFRRQGRRSRSSYGKYDYQEDDQGWSRQGQGSYRRDHNEEGDRGRGRRDRDSFRQERGQYGSRGRVNQAAQSNDDKQRSRRGRSYDEDDYNSKQKKYGESYLEYKSRRRVAFEKRQAIAREERAKRDKVRDEILEKAAAGIEQGLYPEEVIGEKGLAQLDSKRRRVLSKSLKPKEPTYAELLIDQEEIGKLVDEYKSIRPPIKIGRRGVAEGIVDQIHSQWNNKECVKVRIDHIKRYPNVKTMRYELETRTGGLVIWNGGRNFLVLRPRDWTQVKAKMSPFGVTWDEVYAAREDESVGNKAKELLTEDQLKDLLQQGKQMDKPVEVGRRGVTSGLIHQIVSKWRVWKCLKVVIFDEGWAQNVNLLHKLLEERTDGIVISRQPKCLFLARPINYSQHKDAEAFREWKAAIDKAFEQVDFDMLRFCGWDIDKAERLKAEFMQENRFIPKAEREPQEKEGSAGTLEVEEKEVITQGTSETDEKELISYDPTAVSDEIAQKAEDTLERESVESPKSKLEDQEAGVDEEAVASISSLDDEVDLIDDKDNELKVLEGELTNTAVIHAGDFADETEEDEDEQEKTYDDDEEDEEEDEIYDVFDSFDTDSSQSDKDDAEDDEETLNSFQIQLDDDDDEDEDDDDDDEEEDDDYDDELHNLDLYLDERDEDDDDETYRKSQKQNSRKKSSRKKSKVKK